MIRPLAPEGLGVQKEVAEVRLAEPMAAPQVLRVTLLSHVWRESPSYVGAVACVVLSSAIAYGVQPYAQTADLAMIQLLGIVFVALHFNVRISLVSSLVSVALFDFLFIPPRLAFAWSDAKSIITFAGMIVVSAVISALNERLRRQERIARDKAIEQAELANVVHRAHVESETERMRSSLLSAISHDLKTPLSTIVAAGTTLLDRGKTLEYADSRELLSAMVLEAERLGRLIQNLLSVTRLESPTVEIRRSPEAIEELIAAAVERVSARLQANRVHVVVSQDLPWVLAEPALIEQVLINLLENAIRYAGPTSAIDVSAHVENGLVAIQVADRGPGVSDADVEKVFEKFYRGKETNRRDGGAGLGLTICRAIVRAHGGKIGIRHRQGGGAVVEFTLPAAGKLEARPSVAEALAQ